MVLAWGCLALFAPGCRVDPTGKPCTDDDQCGPGFDCYQQTCHVVCSRTEECPSGLECRRHRCQLPATRPTATQPTGAPATAEPLSTVDPTAAELRALRREVELIRRDLDALLHAQGVRSSRPPDFPQQSAVRGPEGAISPPGQPALLSPTSPAGEP